MKNSISLKFLHIQMVVVLSIALSSCIQEITLKEQITGNKLTISALLESGCDFRIKISASTTITSTDTSYVNNAFVYLWKDGVLVDTLENEGNGTYYSPEFINRGSVFTIEAKAEGFPTISATDTVPFEIIPIQNVIIREDDFMDSFGNLYDSFIVEIEDTKEIDLFELFFIKLDVLDTMIYTSYNYLDKGTDPILESEGSNEIYDISVIFDDNLFKDNAYKLWLSSQMGTGSFKSEFFDLKTGKYFVLRNTSTHYYEFRKSLASHLYNQQYKIDFEDYTSFLFDSSPNPLYSNVANGYGIFAFYTQTAYSLPQNY